jgi:thiol-disulfide isomerase/thioredoxin
MIKLKTFFTGLLIILLYTIYIVIFDGEHVKTIIVTLTSIFFVTIFYLVRNDKKTFFASFLLVFPILLLFIIVGFLVDDYSRILQYLIFMPLSNFLAFLYVKTKHKFIIPFSLIVFYFIGTQCFSSIFVYISNRNAEKNIIFPNVTFVNKKNVKVNLNKNKIIVLDFWSTSCGICFEKFPDLESTYEKYKNNENVEIYAVNSPLKKDKFEKTVKVLDSIGYKFPKLYAQSAKEVEDSLHFNTFPHLIIIKNGRIRYDGMFETQKNTFIYSIESEIDKLLKE